MILTFNGHEVPLEDCRISAMPFNRVWTGKQRTPDQTRLAKFASFDLTKPGTLEISGVDADAPARLYPCSESERLVRTDRGLAAPGVVNLSNIRTARHKTQDTRHKTQDTRHKTQDARRKTQDSSWFFASSSVRSVQSVLYVNRETDNGRSGSGNQKCLVLRMKQSSLQRGQRETFSPALRARKEKWQLSQK